jgi:hypothetical protein
MNTLKRKGPRTEPCGTPELARKDCERMNNNEIIDSVTHFLYGYNNLIYEFTINNVDNILNVFLPLITNFFYLQHWKLLEARGEYKYKV